MRSTLTEIQSRTLAFFLLAVLVSAAVVVLGALSPRPAPVPARGGSLADLTLIEPGRGRSEGWTLTIGEDGKIVALETAEESRRRRDIVHTGGYVLPGLIDMHVHQPLAIAGFEEYFALLYLQHGVTSIRDMGYSYPDVFARRERIKAGEFAGPRIFTCGAILDGDPPLWENATVVSSVEAASTTVKRLYEEGADCIKVYTNLLPDVLAAIKVAAAAIGLPVIGHIPAQIPFEIALLDDVQHLIGVPDQVAEARDSNPLAARWSDMSLQRREMIASTSLEYGIAHTPTLVFLDYNSRRDQSGELLSASGAELLPDVFADYFWRPEEEMRLGGAATPELYAQLREAFAVQKRVVKFLHDSGVKIHAGTDTGNPFVVPGVSLHRELALLNETGLNPEQVLATATTVPGEFYLEPGLGQLLVGAPADFLVFSEDPTQSLAALDSLILVVADGRIYTREFLDKEVARYQAHFHNFTWSKVIPLFAGLFD